MGTRKIWADEEIALLREVYPTHTNQELTDLFKRNADAIAAKAKKLGIKKNMDVMYHKRTENIQRKNVEICSRDIEEVSVSEIYKRKDWLFDNYVVQKKTTVEIGEEVGVHKDTINRWMKHHDIPLRNGSDIYTEAVRKKIGNHDQTGERHPRWKGGRFVGSAGYTYVKADGHKEARFDGYVHEHRIVAEQLVGRSLREGEVVHHRDRNRLNNDPDNLFVFPSSSAHSRFHHYQRRIDSNITEEDYMRTIYNESEAK